MLSVKIQLHRALQLSLYSSIALIVISMLFLGKGQTSSSFLVQSATILAAPVFFYIVGIFVYRRLNAPVAAPGIIATGAWLIGVSLIHLYDKRILMPEVLQPYYVLIAALASCSLITITGHRIQTWMIIPLVPFVQVVAVWSLLWALGIPGQWMPPLSFVVVLIWWEIPLRSEEWKTIYRASGMALTLFVLLFTTFLMPQFPQTITTVWSVGALLIAALGLRHGWVRLAPLAIIVLFCASLWSLSSIWWPVAWLTLAVVTILFLERMGTYELIEQNKKSVEASEALAILLSGASVLFAEVSTIFGPPIHPLAVIGILAVAGTLLTWFGWRRELRIASHIGLWMLAGAWANVYLFILPNANTFGLWLALLAVGALLVERLSAPKRKEKHKTSHTVIQTVAFWPLADLIIGLSTLILIWTSYAINSATPQVITITLAITVGIWIAAGLMYRLPVLLHVALWIAPVPYALILIVAAPALWTLPLLGIAWQILGTVFLIMGHSAPRYRPAILAPFFIVGYTLLGFGFSLAMNNAILLPAGLTILVFAAIGTSIAVIADLHPAWNALITKVVDPQKRPFTYNYLNHFFLLLAAWLSAIWLHLMLGYTGMSLPRQGISLVGFACTWFVLGRLLSRLPGVVGWLVISAGWLMWCIGLLEVFFSPAEAMLTMIIGLVVSSAIVWRSRDVYWIPVLIMQVFFTALQLAWIFALPSDAVLMIVAMVICLGGMFYQRYNAKSGLVIAVTGGILAGLVWVFHMTSDTLVGVTILLFAGALHYRMWQLLWAIYPAIFILVLQNTTYIDWETIFIAGLLQWIVAAELVKALRPRRFRTFRRLYLGEYDWATLPLWVGSICIETGLLISLSVPQWRALSVPAHILTTVVFSVYTIRLRVRGLPYLAMLSVMTTIFVVILTSQGLPYPTPEVLRIVVIPLMTLVAIGLYIAINYLVQMPRPFSRMRWLIWWIKPLLQWAFALAVLSSGFMLQYTTYPTFLALNIINGLLLTLFAATVYLKTRERIGLWIAVALGWYSWAFILESLNLHNIFWHTIPLGVMLFFIARKNRNQTALDYVGAAVLLAGSALSLDRAHLFSPASLTLILHILGLAIYGYIGGRRIPFGIGLMLTLAGLTFITMKINVWLVPLIGGLLLMTLTLIIETQRDGAEQLVTDWVSRWASWK